MMLEGRVWKFGGDTRSSVLLSERYDLIGRAGRFAELVPHLNEEADAGWFKRVRPGDLIVAGRAFGTGKHLEGLIGALKLLRIGGVIAKSFYATWERDSINAALPSLVYPEIPDQVETGDVLQIDLAAAEARNVTSGLRIPVRPTAPGLIELLELGGIAAYTLRKLGRAPERAADKENVHV